MILELAIAAGAAAGLFAALRRRRNRSAPVGLGEAIAAARRPTSGLAGGDVLMIPGEELVLGGSIVVDEGGPVLSAFALVGADRDRWLVQLDQDGNDLALTKETSELVGEIPSVLPLGGRTLSLEKRGTAIVSAKGEGVPAIDGARALFVVLAERGGRIAIVIDPAGAARIALVGERLDPRVVDRLGSSSPGGSPGEEHRRATR